MDGTHETIESRGTLGTIVEIQKRTTILDSVDGKIDDVQERDNNEGWLATGRSECRRYGV